MQPVSYVMRLFDVALEKKVTKGVSLACFLNFQPHQSHNTYLPTVDSPVQPRFYTFFCEISVSILVSESSNVFVGFYHSNFKFYTISVAIINNVFPFPVCYWLELFPLIKITATYWTNYFVSCPD